MVGTPCLLHNKRTRLISQRYFLMLVYIEYSPNSNITETCSQLHTRLPSSNTMKKQEETGTINTNSIEEQLLISREKFLSFVQARVSDPNLAEDILQDSFLKALHGAPDLRDQDRLLLWFYRILRNAIIDAYRRQGVERKYTKEIVADEMPAVEMEDTTALCACFSDLLPTLKPEYRELIQSELNEEKQELVLSRLGISLSNLKVRRHRARQALRRRLEETCRMCATHSCLDCTCQVQQASR
jgi:RNA polymerase sigma factor (sigma-70 family)